MNFLVKILNSFMEKRAFKKRKHDFELSKDINKNLITCPKCYRIINPGRSQRCLCKTFLTFPGPNEMHLTDGFCWDRRNQCFVDSKDFFRDVTRGNDFYG